MAQSLTANKRTGKGRRYAKALRNEGRLPAVLYKAGNAGESLDVEERLFRRMLNAGERVLTLNVDGKDRRALIKDVQYDALGEQVLHIDFNELEAGQKVEVNVPVSTRGTAKGQNDGGNLSVLLHELQVSCDPDAIPEKIEVLIEDLEIGQSVTIKDLDLPKGVIVTRDENETVVTIEAPREEKEEEAEVEGAAGPAEPEVLTERKPDEEKQGGDS